MANIGIIGTGWGARVQVPTFREAGLTVVGIAGYHFEKTQDIAGELGVRAHREWREIVADPAVQLVSITAPPGEHLEMATAALEAGKHVLCEKPTALDAAQAAALLGASERHRDRIALIDHELRFLPAWRQAREQIGDTIGTVRYAEVRYSSPARGDRSRGWNWWSDAAQGGGIWGAVGSHFVDALRYFGHEPESVQGTFHTIVDRRPFEGSLREVTSDDLGSIRLRFHGGAVALLQFSVVSAGADEPSVMTIHGEKGAMRFIGEEVLLSRPGGSYERLAGGPLEERPGNSPGGAFGSGTLHLGRALRAALDDGHRSALTPAATFADGLAQQRILDAARASSAEGGRWVGVQN